MTPRPSDRTRPSAGPGFRGMGSWFSLGLLILALIIVLLARQQLANSAASCYATVTTVPGTVGEAQTGPGGAPDAPPTEPNVRVVPPPDQPQSPR